MTRMLSAVVGTIICGMVFAAQDSYTVEGFAQVRDNEVARFYPDSVRESRGEMLFGVVVRYAVPEDAPPGAAASRKISYRARCDSKQMTISLIAFRNTNGQMIKMITVPPGAEDYFKPAAGSREEDWLYRVCG